MFIVVNYCFPNKAIAFENSNSYKALNHTYLDKNIELNKNRHTQQSADITKLHRSAYQVGLDIRNTTHLGSSLYTELHLQAKDTTPRQLGTLGKLLDQQLPASVEEFIVQIFYQGFAGPYISLMRRDIHETLQTERLSTEELWKSTEITDTADFILLEKQPATQKVKSFSTLMGNTLRPLTFNLTLRNKLSPSKGKRDIVYRSTALMGYKKVLTKNRYTRLSNKQVSFNLKNNLDRLYLDVRPINSQPIRSDEDLYAEQTTLLDSLYDGIQFKAANDTHITLGGGYINENFFGFGGEVLKKPLLKNWAIGAEAYAVQKRDPLTFGALGLEDQRLWTAHAKLYYDIPKYDLRLGLRAGAYLDGDVGGTFTASKYFSNGSKIEGYSTLTNKADYNSAGNKTHMTTGIRFIWPISTIVKPFKMAIKTDTHYQTFVRDSGQYITPPFPLIETSEKLDHAHIEKYWSDIKKK